MNYSPHYALVLWDNDTVYYYNLGRYGNADDATALAKEIMNECHEKFVNEDNPCWQVHTASECRVIQCD
jgi:hypothetical protein